MTCTQCEADLPPGIHLCAGCVIRLEATLDQIPDALEAAAETAAKQDVLGSAGATAGAGLVLADTTYVARRKTND